MLAWTHAEWHTPIPDGLAIYTILMMMIDQHGNKAAKVFSHSSKKIAEHKT